jgi:hypothetical protein
LQQPEVVLLHEPESMQQIMLLRELLLLLLLPSAKL